MPPQSAHNVLTIRKCGSECSASPNGMKEICLVVVVLPGSYSRVRAYHPSVNKLTRLQPSGLRLDLARYHSSLCTHSTSEHPSVIEHTFDFCIDRASSTLPACNTQPTITTESFHSFTYKSLLINPSPIVPGAVQPHSHDHTLNPRIYRDVLHLERRSGC
jgi:hypothetical protein